MTIADTSAHRPDAHRDSVLAERTFYRRAVEAAIWGMPVVSFDAMRQAYFRDAGARYHDVVYWSRPADWRLQLTTPNASSYYAYINFNTRDGPVVLDLPPASGAGLFGSLNDSWQVPLVDVGPAGADLGRGGRYLILPPGYTRAAPPGFIAVRSPTYNGYAALRAIPVSYDPGDVARALDLVRDIRVYRLDEADAPPEQRFIDMAGRLFDGIARFDEGFYDALARMITEEPTQRRDFVAMGQLRTLGIERGVAFAPDVEASALLTKAVAEAHAFFMNAVTEGEAHWHGSQWIHVGGDVGPRTGFTFESDDYLDVDARGTLFFLGCAPPKKMGAASFYLFGMRDAAGEPLHGARSYRLRVPADVPAKQFWAVTVYDLATAAFIRGATRIEVSSYRSDVQRNTDGSVDVYFGPASPQGREGNWISTAGGHEWFAAFRCYGPKPPLLDRSWRLGEIHEVR